MLRKNIFQEALSLIVEERVHKVAANKAQQDPTYQKLDDECSTLLKLLSAALTTEEQRLLLSRLEENWNAAEDLMREYAYRQGIEDSAMLHQELRRFGIQTIIESRY